MNIHEKATTVMPEETLALIARLEAATTVARLLRLKTVVAALEEATACIKMEQL